MPPKRAKKKPPAKKQTRLTFAPVNPSTTASSPAVNKMAPANVRYQLPTPATSSQTLTLGGEGGEGEGDEGMDDGSKDLEEEEDEDEDIRLPGGRRVLRSVRNAQTVTGTPRGVQKTPGDMDDGEDDEEDEDIRLPSGRRVLRSVRNTATRTPRGAQKPSGDMDDGEDDEDDDVFITSARPSTRKSLAKTPIDTDENSPTLLRNTRSTRASAPLKALPPQSRAQTYIILSDSDDDEDELALTEKPKPNGSKDTRLHPSFARTARFRNFAACSDDEDDKPVFSGAKKHAGPAIVVEDVVVAAAPIVPNPREPTHPRDSTHIQNHTHTRASKNPRKPPTSQPSIMDDPSLPQSPSGSYECAPTPNPYGAPSPLEAPPSWSQALPTSPQYPLRSPDYPVTPVLPSTPRQASPTWSTMGHAPTPPQARTPTPQPTLGMDEGEDEDMDDGSPVRRGRRPPTRMAKGKGKEKQVIESSDDADDDQPSLPAASRARGQARIVDDDDSDAMPLATPLKRRLPVDESEDSDINPSTVKRSRTTRGARTQVDNVLETPTRNHTRGTRTQANDVLETPIRTPTAASPSVPSTRRRKPRKLKPRGKQEKAFELLRRRRAGEKIEKVSSSEDDDDSSPRESTPALYDSDLDEGVDALKVFLDDEPSPEEVQKARARLHAQHQRGSDGEPGRRRREGTSSQDEDLEGFIVDDDENAMLGAPVDEKDRMPLQFTRDAHKPLKDYFFDCVEWLVHSHLDEDFPDREAEKFRYALSKVDDEARGYAVSVFISPSWTRDFTLAIKNRPVLTHRYPMDGEGQTDDGIDKCDACNHKKHPAKYVISFSGKPYEKKTLEVLEQDSDYDSDDPDATPEDEEGATIPPVSQEWFTGRDCAGKAFHAHKLIHWRHTLNEAVVENLENGGYLADEEIAQRAASTADRRQKMVGKAFEAMESGGGVLQLWVRFKRMMEDAKNYEPKRYGRSRR